MFVPLHHVQKGTRLSPSLLFIVVVLGESLGTRLVPDSIKFGIVCTASIKK